MLGLAGPEAKAIVSAKECRFQSNAEQMLASMNTLNRYPIFQYIEELKARRQKLLPLHGCFGINSRKAK